MEEKSVFDEFDTKTNILRRRALLPVWIKIFIWIFLCMGLIAVLILAFGFFLNNNARLSVYGLETTSIYSPIGLIILSILIFKGIVSYGLWFEQEWGPKAAVIDAFLGIFICGITMLILPFITNGHHFTMRFEFLFLIPYLTKMQKIQKTWIKL